MITNPAIGTLGNTTGPAFFSTFFGGLLTLILIVGSVIFIFMMIFGAIQWISSGNDKNSVEGAKQRITNALVGLILLFSVFIVVNLVSYFFGGINLLEPILTPLTGGAGSSGPAGGGGGGPQSPI